MKLKYPNLCEPIKIGNVTFKNRMFSAPMGGTNITADCCIGRGSTAFYELRAKGGAQRSPSANVWFTLRRMVPLHII